MNLNITNARAVAASFMVETALEKLKRTNTNTTGSRESMLREMMMFYDYNLETVIANLETAKELLDAVNAGRLNDDAYDSKDQGEE